jgi:hypothetical protein
LRECELAVDDFGADGLEDLPQFGLGPGGAEEPGRGADDGDGLLRRTLVAIGREIQSTAFLSAPGTDALYSGVANRTASAAAILMAHHAQRGDVIAAGAGLVVFIERWSRLDQGRVEFNELDTGR